MECKDGKKNGKRIPKWAGILAILIPAVSSAGVAWYTLIKGDPDAAVAKSRIDKTWRKMLKKVNRLTKAYNKLHLRVVYFQAREEGATSGVLKAKLDQLQFKYDQLVLKQARKSRASAPQVEILRGMLAEERKLRAKVEKRKRSEKAVKNAGQLPQLPAPPPWGK